MGRLLYYLVIYPVSLLPYPLLYRLSDGLYFLFYFVLGFWKKVVMGNLDRVFPDKPVEERRRIAKAFYRHLCDLILEVLKGFSVSEEELLKRCRVENPEVLEPYFAQGKSIIITAGHYNNWEMVAMSCNAQIAHHAIGIYKPLKNKFFDRKLAASRGNLGMGLISFRKLKTYLEEYRGQPIALMFGTDQCPRNPHRAYWMEFLGQETGVMFGTEKYAKEYDLPVFHGSISKSSRGHYTFSFTLLTDDPQSAPYGQITELHTRALEADILAAPEYWLWSHKRWKRPRPVAAEEESLTQF